MAVLALLISVVALVLAGLGAAYARQQATQTGARLAEARDQAAETARHLSEVRRYLDEVRHGMSALEAQASQTSRLRDVVLRDRHELLAPQFDVILSVAEDDPQALRPRLRLHLVGPRGLDRLDAVTVTIRDAPAAGAAADPADDADGAGSGGEQQEGDRPAEAADPVGDGVVHGPYRFPPGTDGADELGRSVAPVPLEADEWHVLRLERTPTPDDHPGGAQAWQEAYPATLPVRLLLHCERDGYQPWDLRCEAVPVRHR